MLTDIFADRYIDIPMWDSIEDIDKKILVQGFRIVSEQLYPYWVNGKESPKAKEVWTAIHDKLSMELGLSELSPQFFFGPKQQLMTSWNMDKRCKGFVCAEYDDKVSPDRFMKERLSLIELAFREREEQIEQINADLPKNLMDAKIRDSKKTGTMGIRLPGSSVDSVQIANDILNKNFRSSTDELNERLRRANYKLNYHNGFIQISEDKLIEEQIEKEFWLITKNSIWKNVDTEMKVAIDLRDTGGKDPSFYAARALESTIKIISDQKGWTHSGEKGAHNYIDNLGSKKNGQFIIDWEIKALKLFFTEIRNPVGHGSGSEDIPELSKQQTDWVIETCMSWVKTLVKRF